LKIGYFADVLNKKDISSILVDCLNQLIFPLLIFYTCI